MMNADVLPFCLVYILEMIKCRHIAVPSEFLRSSFVKLHLVNSPHGSFDVLHSHEALVQTKVVSHRIL